MQLPRSPIAPLCLAALLALGACSTSAAPARQASAADAPEAVAPEEAPPAPSADAVQGNVVVSWRNLDPRYPATAVGLVNESSEMGQKLKKGLATSSEIRVLTDEQMGLLLGQLRSFGFYEYAKPGLDAKAAQQVPGAKGLVLVEQDGKSLGLLLTTGLGTSGIPKAYVESKKLVNGVHGQVQGFDVKANVGASDDRVLSVPPPRLKRP